jgi:mediator of RNA polymerase II transcription subunit 18
MHESILYAQIPAARHKQVLHVLAGVTATQPIDFSEQHLVYQQTKNAEFTAPKKGQAAQPNRAAQLSYYKLIRDCSAQEDPKPWRVRKEEQPEAGVKDVISRTVGERMATEENLERFKLGSEWYKSVSYILTTKHILTNERQTCRPIPHHRLPLRPRERRPPHCESLHLETASCGRPTHGASACQRRREGSG